MIEIISIAYMDLSSVTIQQLRYLSAVADGDTFGAAADELFVSQSALSQGLARLEALVGIPLFEDDGRRRRLTDAGLALADGAGRILAESKSLAADIERRAAGERGVLRLGMIDAVALYLFPDVIARFRESRPDIEVLITVKGSEDCLVRLAGFEDDLSIVVGPGEGFATTIVAEEDLHVFGPRERIPADAGWVLYPTGSHTRALIDDGLRAIGIVPQVVGESGNPAVLRQLAVLNGNWTVLPSTLGGLGELTQGSDVGSREIVVARRSDTPENAVAQAFVEALAN